MSGALLRSGAQRGTGKRPMSDALIVANATQALVLADARQEDALALLEDGPKRKAHWTGQSIPKKGKRWGLADDKPFKPLPYVDLPVGFEEKEVDQFLREQRLEDLARKIQLQILEDVDPDIRPPSPPPIYDKQGNRLNTREIRIRKAMLAEYNRLIRFMMKNIEGYVPPPEWKPQKLVKKIIVPIEKYPQAPFTGVIIGARGVNHKRLQETSGCRIFIRGKDIGDKFQTDEEMQMPMHVHIEGDTEDQIEAAEKLIEPLLNPESPEFEYARTHGMQQVALVNGFTLNKAEQRCGICGAIGHLGFDCPESEGFNYKMANVCCTICGDKGHVASDCKQVIEKHQRENVDWKAEAEKRQQMDSEYRSFMSELGVEVKEPPPETAAGMQPPRNLRPPSRPGIGFSTQQPPPRLVPPVRPVPGSTTSAPGGAVASAGVVALCTTNPGTGVAPRPGGMHAVRPPEPAQLRLPDGQVVRPVLRAPSRPMMRPAPRIYQPPTAAESWPLSNPPRLVAPVVRASQVGNLAAALRNRPPMRPPPPMRAPPPIVRGAPDVDDSLLCPQEMISRLVSGGVLAEMSRDTGARMCVDVTSTEVGGKCVLVAGTAEAREKAKLHFRMWLDVNMGSTAPSSWSGAVPPRDGFVPGGFPSDGFPPDGFPPDGFPPDGFLPDGFPPAGAMAGSFPPLGDFSSEALPPRGGFMPPGAGFPPGLGRPPPSGLPPGLQPSPAIVSPPPPASVSTPPPASVSTPPPLRSPPQEVICIDDDDDPPAGEKVCAPPGMPDGFGVTWDEL